MENFVAAKEAADAIAHLAGCNATSRIYDLLDETFESDAVKGAIALDAILGAEWGPRSPGTVLTYLYRLSGLAGGEGMGVAQPAGGMGAVAQAFAAAATSAGAQLRLSSPVKRVLVEGDRAVGVELLSGETIRARRVISNADPQTTFMKLLGPAHLDTGFVRRLSHLRQSGRAGKLHLARAAAPASCTWHCAKFRSSRAWARKRSVIAW